MLMLDNDRPLNVEKMGEQPKTGGTLELNFAHYISLKILMGEVILRKFVFIPHSLVSLVRARR